MLSRSFHVTPRFSLSSLALTAVAGAALLSYALPAQSFIAYAAQGVEVAQIVLKPYDDGNVADKSTRLATKAVASAQALISCFGSVGCLPQQRHQAKKGGYYARYTQNFYHYRK